MNTAGSRSIQDSGTTSWSSEFDTLLAVYTGDSVDALTSKASNDNVSATDLTSKVTVNVVAGTTYYIAVDGKKVIDVTLVETASNLGEVIITAYGTKETRENQVGSALKITSKDLEMRPLNRIDQLLEGIVPGLEYSVQDGTASSARPRFQTRLRGESSFGSSNEPLWVVDGIKINTGDETNMILGANTSISPLSYLNPTDIESITILKDATATSIYGADGANGVILVTTKKGYNGKPQV
ncbi:MAG: hypothetical protein EOP02_30290, partial [Proteobacteria bacterium]